VAPASAGRAGRWIRLSNANPQVTEFDLGEYETVRWKSTDGQTVEGLLIKPVGYEAGKRYPLIVQIHGGPAGARIRSFSAGHGDYVHVFAGGGYAVFQPNYRAAATPSSSRTTGARRITGNDSAGRLPAITSARPSTTS